MKITIIGAAAGIGREAVAQGLAKGHHITALSPNAQMIPDAIHLTKVNGSATNVDDLIAVMRDADAVLITVGTKKKKGTTLFSDIATSLVAATERLQYRKPILIVTGFGSGDSKAYLNFFLRTVIRLFLKDQYADKSIMEEHIIGSKMNWEIIRPTMLTNGRMNEHYSVTAQLTNGMNLSKISRANVAHYLLAEAERQINLGKCIAITGK